MKRVASNYRSLKRDPRPLLDVIEQSKADIIVLKFSNRPVEIIQNILDEYRIEIPIIRAEHGNVEDLVDTIWKKNWRRREATFSTASRIHLLGKNFLESSRFPLELFCKTFTCPSPVYERAVVEKTENDRCRFIFSGRLERYEKNAIFALTAFLQVSERLDNWDLHFMGDGSSRPEMEELAKEKGYLNSRVFFHGSLLGAELESAYRSGDIFLITSDVEGAPVALGEALAYSVPAIGFEYCTGVNERIVHEENGLLAKNKKDFVQKMVLLAEDKVLRKKFSSNAKNIFKRYNFEEIFQNWIINFQIACWFGKAKSERLASFPGNAEYKFVDFNTSTASQPNLSGLSIVVPYFNMETQFAFTVDKFNAAAAAGAKIYIIDDGSKIGLAQTETCELLHETIEYVRTFNFGAGSARNLGLSYVQSEFVLFFDADDSLDIANLSFALEQCRREKFDFIVLPFTHLEISKGKLREFVKPKYNEQINCRSDEEFAKVFCPQIDASSCNKIIRCEFLQSRNICFPSNYRLEDVAFNAMCHGGAGSVGVGNLPIGSYNKFEALQRKGSANWNASKLKDALVLFSVLDKFYVTDKQRLFSAVYFLPFVHIWRNYRDQFKIEFPYQYEESKKIVKKLHYFESQVMKLRGPGQFPVSNTYPSWLKIRVEEYQELRRQSRRPLLKRARRLLLKRKHLKRKQFKRKDSRRRVSRRNKPSAWVAFKRFILRKVNVPSFLRGLI